jgi:signal transduction histidine kinase/ActR/RegA family two-component response regulator
VRNKGKWGLVLGRTISDLVKRRPEGFRLRTRLLLFFVLVTTSLTCATLLVVRRNAHTQAQREIERDARTATSTFLFIQKQQQMELARRADLLASLAFMRNGDVTTIEDASNDPWQTNDCNLFLLTDKDSKIMALRSSGAAFPIIMAQQQLTNLVSRGETSGWWFSGKNLYQVVLQPFYDGASTKRNLQGFVVVGRVLDDRAASDLGKISTSDVVFRFGDKVAASTLPAPLELELTKQIHGRLATAQVTLAQDQYYASVIELAQGQNPGTSLIVLKSYNEMAAYLQKLNHVLLAIGLVATLVGGLLIFVVSDTLTRPLASLVSGVLALEKGDFTFPLEAGGHDELSKLTRAFDGMRSTLQRNEEKREQLEGQLRQAQKMEALGRLAGGVAHDFNNLLTVIRGHSELLTEHLKPGDALHNNCEQIRKTADRAASFTRQLLAFSRKQVLQAKVLDANELLADMGKLLRRLVREDIELSLQLGDSLWKIKADPGQLEQAILNLTVNASDAMPMGGKLNIETQNFLLDKDHATLRSPMEPGEYVVLRVTDTGHGMDADTKAHIFEPFFTTKEPGKGTGLGLATVYGVVKQSGGFIWVESEPEKGTRFEVYLPKTNERAAGQLSKAHTKSTACASRQKTVLVVEDEREVRELACQFLTAAGYSVLTAEDGKEALETAERLGRSIHVVLTDIVMPNMRGTELSMRLRRLCPNLKIVYMTGYCQQELDRGELLGDAFFLQKPFSREAVARQISLALNSKSAKIKQPQTTLV